MKTRILIAIAVICIIALALCRRPNGPSLDIAVLDNTVPDRSFREHQGLFEVLDDGYINSRTGTGFSLEDDYFGFVPLGDDSYTIRKPPENLESVDIFYLADAYGVYSMEFYGKNPSGRRSQMIFGGLSVPNLVAIRAAIGGGATLIAEFNSFASPTSPEVREELTGILGVNWDGWMGRYFTNLSKGQEVPEWAVENYERKYQEKWSYFGPGYIFVNEENIVVLRETEEIERYGSEFVLTEKGGELFPDARNSHYRYWFDIVAVDTTSATVLAEFALKLTSAGAAALEREKIPVRFPAIIMNKHPQYTSFYFAGDFADRNDRLAFLKHNPEIAFFRRVYRPVMKRLLDHIAAGQTRPARFP